MERKDTQVKNLNETLMQLKNVISEQSENISHSQAGLRKEIASLQQLASTLNKKIQGETIQREKTVEQVKKQLKLDIENNNANILWLNTKFNSLQLNSSILDKMFQEERFRRKNFTNQLTFELTSQNENISLLRKATIGLSRKVNFLQQNASTLNKMIRQETTGRENVTKQLTLELASQNTNLSYLHEKSTGLSRRVELLQQNVSNVNKRFQREKGIQNITVQLRQEITSQKLSTTKKLLLLASNVSELFQETTNNKKLFRDESYNITKQVNFLTQKQKNLDHMNNIVQKNLTELLNEAAQLNRKAEFLQQNTSTLSKLIQQEITE